MPAANDQVITSRAGTRHRARRRPALAAVADRNPWVVGDLTRYLFPKYAVEPGTLALADDLLGRGDVTPAVRRAVETGATEMRRALAAREAYPPPS